MASCQNQFQEYRWSNHTCLAKSARFTSRILQPGSMGEGTQLWQQDPVHSNVGFYNFSGASFEYQSFLWQHSQNYLIQSHPTSPNYIFMLFSTYLCVAIVNSDPRYRRLIPGPSAPITSDPVLPIDPTSPLFPEGWKVLVSSWQN